MNTQVTTGTLLATLFMLWFWDSSATDDFVVAGYLPDYRFYIDVNSTALHLTDLFLFSLQPNAYGTAFPCCLGDDHYETVKQAVTYKQEQQDKRLRVWLTVGGGGRSFEFLSAMDHGDNLAHSIGRLAKSHGIYGIDIDCEHFTSQNDYQKYVHWVHRAVKVFQKEYQLKVSLALHVGTVLPTIIFQQLDRVHLMAYDIIGDSQAKYHADLVPITNAVDKLIQGGCAESKILLGLPAYARHPKNPGMVKTFAELVDAIGDDKDIASLNEWQGIRGDSPQIIVGKVAYAQQQKLGGVFFWELGQDKQVNGNGGYLLEAAAQQAKSQSTGDEL